MPFIGEAKTRVHLLHMYLKHSFKDKFQEFWEFISEDDEFIRHSEKEAYDALNKMDMLRLLGKLEDNSPDETQKSVEEVKLDLLYIHTQPSDRRKSQVIQIQNMSKDIWLDIGTISSEFTYTCRELSLISRSYLQSGILLFHL